MDKTSSTRLDPRNETGTFHVLAGVVTGPGHGFHVWQWQSTSVSTRARESPRGWVKGHASYSVFTWGKLFVSWDGQDLKHQVGSQEWDRDLPCPCRRCNRTRTWLPCVTMTEYKCLHAGPRKPTRLGQEPRVVLRLHVGETVHVLTLDEQLQLALTTLYLGKLIQNLVCKYIFSAFLTLANSLVIMVCLTLLMNSPNSTSDFDAKKCSHVS